MDPLHERLDALESQVQALTQHASTVTRRLRWWRGLARGLAVLGLLGWGLPLGLAGEEDRQQELGVQAQPLTEQSQQLLELKAQNESLRVALEQQNAELAARLARLEEATARTDKDKDQEGLAQRVAALEQLLEPLSREQNEIFITGANLHIVNGLGQTDCGPVPDCPNGLGNLIVGYNELRGAGDVRTGSHNVVVGTRHNFSRFGGIVVGILNEISGDFAVVSGGQRNTASGFAAAVSGGGDNTASGALSSVSGGFFNAASGAISSVSGGGDNTASGPQSSVSGGGNITQETEQGWAAGSEGAEVVVGNFRSP
jgi:hypothetical protein